jgi:hypothetical protein
VLVVPLAALSRPVSGWTPGVERGLDEFDLADMTSISKGRRQADRLRLPGGPL